MLKINVTAANNNLTGYVVRASLSGQLCVSIVPRRKQKQTTNSHPHTLKTSSSVKCQYTLLKLH